MLSELYFAGDIEFLLLGGRPWVFLFLSTKLTVFKAIGVDDRTSSSCCCCCCYYYYSYFLANLRSLSKFVNFISFCSMNFYSSSASVVVNILRGLTFESPSCLSIFSVSYFAWCLFAGGIAYRDFLSSSSILRAPLLGETVKFEIFGDEYCLDGEAFYFCGGEFDFGGD